MTEHKRLSASGFTRFAACPGSPALCDIAPPSPGNRYSREGTTVHYCADKLIANHWAVLVGTVCPDSNEVINESHIQNALTYVHECLTYTPTAVVWHTEFTFDGSWLHPDVGGTPDFAVLMPSGELIIIDEKNGYEVADADLQLMVYAVLFIQWLSEHREYRVTPVRSVTLLVIQPNCEDPSARRVQKHYPDAAQWYGDAVTHLSGIALATDDVEAPRVPGDHCHYCPAAPLCPENRRRVSQAAAKYFDLARVEVKQLTADEVGDELQFLDELKKQVSERAKQVLSHAKHMADKQGATVPGYKLVEDLANRTYADASLAATTAKLFGVNDDALYSLRTPAQLEKILPKGVLDNFVERRVKGTKLVATGSRGAPAIAAINQWFNHQNQDN